MAKQKTIFLSYCHKDTKHANSIDKDLRSVGLEIRRDVRDVGYKDSFKEFMRKIRKSDHAILLLSEDFLQSRNCICEMMELLEDDKKFKDKILPVMVESLSIFKPEGKAKLIRYWQDQEKRLEAGVRGIEPVNLGPLTEELKKAQEISASISGFITTICDMKLLTLAELKTSGYKELLNAIDFDKDAIISNLLEIKAIEDEEDQDNAIDLFIEKHSSVPEAYLVKGEFKYQKNKYKRALYFLDKALIINPDNVIALYNKSVALGKLRRYEEALVASEQALKITPDNAEAWFSKSTALAQLGLYEKALEASEQVLKINPDYAEALCIKCIVLVRLEQHEKALKAIEKALRINPDYAEAWFEKGDVLVKLGEPEEALKAFEQALRINPDFAEAWFGKGDVLVKLGEPEEALKAFEQTLRIDLGFAVSWFKKGTVLGKLGEPEEALKAFEQALKINPDYTDAWSNKGVALVQLNRYMEALEAIEQALRIDPDFAEAWFVKGTALVRLDRYMEALEAIERALRIDPNFAEA